MHLMSKVAERTVQLSDVQVGIERRSGVVPSSGIGIKKNDPSSEYLATLKLTKLMSFPPIFKLLQLKSFKKV